MRSCDLQKVLKRHPLLFIPLASGKVKEVLGDVGRTFLDDEVHPLPIVENIRFYQGSFIWSHINTYLSYSHVHWDLYTSGFFRTPTLRTGILITHSFFSNEYAYVGIPRVAIDAITWRVAELLSLPGDKATTIPVNFLSIVISPIVLTIT